MLKKEVRKLNKLVNHLLRKKMENNNINDSSEMPNSSKVYALFYSFFLIPFMLAIFGAMFFYVPIFNL